MSYLLDTHALLWWLFADPKLSRRASGLLRDPNNEVLVSSASAWEIAIKFRSGRLSSAAPLVQDFSGWIERAGFVELAMSASHCITAGGWNVDHKDPFDRMLAAQAVEDGLQLVSRDPVFADFGVTTVW